MRRLGAALATTALVFLILAVFIPGVQYDRWFLGALVMLLAGGALLPPTKGEWDE